MTIITLLVKSYTWEGAATDLTSTLWDRGVKKGSILWIDAHCEGEINSLCHLTAYWDDRFETTEEKTHIKYKLINNSFSWENFYNQADQFVSMLEPRDVISITASCSLSLPITPIAPFINTSSMAVLFVFYFDKYYYHNNFELTIWGDPNSAIPTPAVINEIPIELPGGGHGIMPPLMGPVITGKLTMDMLGVPKLNISRPIIREKQIIKHCEVRDNDWNGAAERIISELENKGAKAGQIIAIDAHNNAATGQAIFSAWWNESLPNFGDLNGYMMKEGINNLNSWEAQAIEARDFITNLQSVGNGKTIKVFSFTSCINNFVLSYGVTYTFYAKDEVVKDGFILDEENIKKKEPVRCMQIPASTHDNPTDVITDYTLTLSESSEKTSTFTSTYERTSGWKLTAGANITLPDIPVTISTTAEKNQSETWKEMKEFFTKESNALQTTTKFNIPAQSILVVKVIEEISEFSAPYKMTMVSGRVSSGIWITKKRAVTTSSKPFPLDTPGDVIKRELDNTDLYT
ncbi:uncharacterized protein LOC134821876 [Bolinopsis microptera]|uniref:uncharacterized protein LOC134821876 n=1 Tax=Bolinopsis microptera TaxID=2820187 RepID=UPI00307A2AF2